MPYSDVPAFLALLRERESVSARALEFLILTASRTTEVTEARWEEIDFDAKVWTVPASRMKSGRPHRVPLCDRAVEILRGISRLDCYRGFIFPGANEGKPLSNMAMLQLVRGLSPNGFVVHGFRSSFKDWTRERTNFDTSTVEAALAHVVGDKVEAAYIRGDLLDKRRKLMDSWARYLDLAPGVASNVVTLGAQRA
jgi:integrase